MNGAILDWYGTGSYEETAAEVWRREVINPLRFDPRFQDSFAASACPKRGVRMPPSLRGELSGEPAGTRELW
jgi:hypothetical protein